MPKDDTNEKLIERVKALENENNILRRKNSAASSHVNWHSISESVSDLILLVGKNADILDLNRTIFNREKTEVIGTKFYSYIPEKYRKDSVDCFEKVCRTGDNACFLTEYEVENRGNRYLEVIVTPMFQDKEIVALTFSARDITEKRLLELNFLKSKEKLNRQCEFLTSIINSFHYPFYVIDPSDYRLIMKNSTADNAGISGKTACYEVIYSRTEPCEPGLCPVQQILETKSDVQIERRALDKDSRYRDYTILASPFFDNSGNVNKVIISNIDVSEIKEMEARTKEIQKIKAITTLSGGIAHQFNNSLAVISGNVELLKFDFYDNPLIKEFIDPVMEQIHRMSSLTKQLLAYSEGGKYNVNKISPQKVITDVISSLQHRILPNVKLKLEPFLKIQDIKADLTQIHMAISAVILNALEAVGNEGLIQICAKNETVTEGASKLKTGTYVCIEIDDDGKGMDPETLERVYEPFYTTNFQGRGLGMAATYGIIKNHGGLIDIDSKVGQGTRVKIYLPSFPEKLKTDAQKKASSEDDIHSRNVLLIEDEEMIIEVGEKMLQKIGYRSFVARSGKEALEIARNNKDIDIAILDIGLPDIGGRQLYPRLKELLPKLKVMVCSGFSIDGPAREIIEEGADVFLQKPFEFKMFSKKLLELGERREHKRFRAVLGTIANLSVSSENAGEILDVSQGGLSMTFIEGLEEDCKDVMLSIKMDEENFSLDDVQCKIVSNNSGIPDNGDKKSQTDRVSVQFENLTMEQAGLLEYFIRNFTIPNKSVSQ